MAGTALLGIFPGLCVITIELESDVDKLGVVIALDEDFSVTHDDELENGNIVEDIIELPLQTDEEGFVSLLIKLLDEEATIFSDLDDDDDNNDVCITRFSKLEEGCLIEDVDDEDFIIVLLLLVGAGEEGGGI